MFSILYLEVVELKRDTYSVLYYLLDFSGNYLCTSENEKTYGKESSLSEEGVVQLIARLLNSLGGGISELRVLTDIGFEDLTLKFINMTEAYLYVSRGVPFAVQTIADYVGIPNISLFGYYSMKFGSPDINTTKIEVIDRVVTLNELRHEAGNTAYLILQVVRRYGCYVLTSCWLTVNIRNEATILGSHSEYFSMEEDNYIRVYRYFSDLCLGLAKSGMSLGSVHTVFYSENSYRFIVNWLSRYGKFQFSKPVFLSESLKGMVSERVSTVIGDSQEKFMRIFSPTLKDNYDFTALDYGYLLREQFVRQSLGVSDTRFTSETIYRKDFSSDIVQIAIDTSKTYRYCIILDCEGSSLGGCSEVGGLIVAYDRGMLIKLETFYFKNRDFSEGMQNVISRFEKLSGRGIPSAGIPVLTYGNSDSGMISTELSLSVTRTIRRRLSKAFRFVDCKVYTDDYIMQTGLQISSFKQSDIAKAIGVEVVRPKHTALNDAKTLFNILSLIYLEGGKFVL